MNKKEFVQALENWFIKNRVNRNRWNATLIGQIIKKYVNQSNNWKNAPRGNPRKANLAKYERNN